MPRMTNQKQNFIESLSEELNVKHLSIIKGENFHVDLKIFNFAKKMFRKSVFVSFMTSFEMEVSMNNYYKTPLGYYIPYMRNNEHVVEYNKRINWVYPPRTIVIPYGNNVEGIINKLFLVRN